MTITIKITTSILCQSYDARHIQKQITSYCFIGFKLHEEICKLRIKIPENKTEIVFSIAESAIAFQSN